MRTDPEMFAVPHLACGTAVDRVFDRLESHETPRPNRERNALLRRAAKVPSFGNAPCADENDSYGDGFTPRPGKIHIQAGCGVDVVVSLLEHEEVSIAGIPT